MPPDGKRLLIFSGSAFESTFAYSRAVVQGDWCFVAGTTGYDYATMAMPLDALAQAGNALATIARVLGEAGFAMGDVVRVRYVVTEAGLRHEIAPALRAAFPAMLGRMARRRNSLRSLRSLRSDICAKSVIDARCARGPSRLRFSAPPKGDGASPDDPWRGRLVVVAGSSCASLRLPLPRGGRGRNPKAGAAIC